MQMNFLQIALTAGMALSCLTSVARENKQQPNPSNHYPIFVSNAGQITDQFKTRRNDIDFRISLGNGLNAFLSNTGISYQWIRVDNKQFTDANLTDDRNLEDLEKENYSLYRMDVALVGANMNAKLLKESGSEALKEAMFYYGGVNDAAKKGINEAKPIYDDLKERFSRKSKPKPPTT